MAIWKKLTDPKFVLEAGGRKWWKPKAKLDKTGQRLVFMAKPEDARGTNAGLLANLRKPGLNYNCGLCG